MTRVLACLAVAGCRLHFDDLPQHDASVPSVDTATGTMTLTFGERPTSMRQGVTRDTSLNLDFPTANYGGDESLWATGDAGIANRALLAFDLSSIDAGTRLVDARLSLVVIDFGDEVPGPVTAFELIEPWGEGTLAGTVGPGATWVNRDTGTAWATAGGSLAGMVATPAVPAGDVTLVLSTTLVQRWIDTPSSNVGVAVTAPATTDETHYHFESSESPAAAKRPELVLVIEP